MLTMRSDKAQLPHKTSASSHTPSAVLCFSVHPVSSQPLCLQHPGQPHTSLKAQLSIRPSWHALPRTTPQDGSESTSTHLKHTFRWFMCLVPTRLSLFRADKAQSKCDRGVCCCHYHPQVSSAWHSVWSSAGTQCTSV